MSDWLIRRHGTALLLAVLVTAVTWAAMLAEATIRQDVLFGLIYLVIVVGLYVFTGNSHVVSFGHVSFVAIGAYTSAILTVPSSTKSLLLPSMPTFLRDTELALVPTLLVAALVGAACAALSSVLFVRLNGLQAGISTFALLWVTRVVIGNWRSVTAGPGTLAGIPRGATLQSAAGAAVLAIVAAWWFQRSSVGRQLRASREDEVAALGCGIDVYRCRARAFVLSGAICAVGGGLYAQTLGSINPDNFYLNMTFLILAMLIVGGMSSLTGAVIGTAAVMALSEVLVAAENGVVMAGVTIDAPPGIRELGLAAALVAVLIWRPAGITGGRELRFPEGPLSPKRRGRSPKSGAADPQKEVVPVVVNVEVAVPRSGPAGS